MTQNQTPKTERLDPRPGAAVYSPWVLRIYDPMVLGFSNTYLWKCPTPYLLEHYNRHISSRHLDVGVGSGYFLDHCRFPGPDPTVALLDLNEQSLHFTAKRIARYHPVSYRGSVLEPLQIDLAPFQSIGLNYLLHCLPGTMKDKACAFEHLKPLLAPGGAVFGSTLLGEGVPRSRLARALMAKYNARGIFSNRTDSLEGLRSALSGLRDVQVDVRGCVALFSARA